MWGLGQRLKSTLEAKGSQKSILKGHKNKAGMSGFNLFPKMGLWLVILGCFFSAQHIF